jgi:hypothetical protein
MTNVFALRLLPVSSRDKDAESLALRPGQAATKTAA